MTQTSHAENGQSHDVADLSNGSLFIIGVVSLYGVRNEASSFELIDDSGKVASTGLCSLISSRYRAPKAKSLSR
jgi:hypothetical protein